MTTDTTIRPVEPSSTELDENGDNEFLFVTFDSPDLHPTTTVTLDPDIAGWTVPDHLSRDYRIYRAGVDLQYRPIWIVELGKWDMRRVVEAGEKEIFEKYVQKAIHIAAQSAKEARKEGNVGVLAIIDMAGLKLNQLLSFSSVNFMLHLSGKYKESIEYLEIGFAINLGPAGISVLNLVKPILWKILSRFQFDGKDKAKWSSKILKYCDPSQIPEAYGGTGEFNEIL